MVVLCNLWHQENICLVKIGSASLIPFTKGEIAKSTSPLKMYEYMAMRKPIVATEDLIECHGYDGVFISKNKINDFEQKIAQAIKSISDQKIINALDRYAQNNTWQKRAQLIAQKLEILDVA